MFAPVCADSGPPPDGFDACTVNVYAVALVSPVTGICTYVFPLLPVMLPAEPTAVVVVVWAAPGDVRGGRV